MLGGGVSRVSSLTAKNLDKMDLTSPPFRFKQTQNGHPFGWPLY